MNDTESRKAFEAWCNETGRYFTTQNTEAWAVWKHLYAEVESLEKQLSEQTGYGEELCPWCRTPWRKDGDEK